MTDKRMKYWGFHQPHDPVDTDTGDEMVTKQSHKDECDIHNILRSYQQTGVIQHINDRSPIFDDLPSDLDYQASMNLMLDAQAAFAALPAKVRDHYHNDPARFLAAFQDPAQEDTLRGFGLLSPKADPSPTLPSNTPSDTPQKAADGS